MLGLNVKPQKIVIMFKPFFFGITGLGGFMSSTRNLLKMPIIEYLKPEVEDINL
jgi:hypothetical protein